MKATKDFQDNWNASYKKDFQDRWNVYHLNAVRNFQEHVSYEVKSVSEQSVSAKTGLIEV
jgi:hypothetical protein